MSYSVRDLAEVLHTIPPWKDTGINEVIEHEDRVELKSDGQNKDDEA